MRLVGIGANVLTDEEFDRLHNGALDVLETVGLQIDTPALLDVCAEAGGTVVDANRVVFKRHVVERYLANVVPPKPGAWISAGVGVYAGYYLDPFTDEYREWNMADLTDYVKVARALPAVDGVGMTTSPILEHGALGPLYERLLAWKRGISSGGSGLDTRLCPYIHELHQMRAEWLGCDIQQASSVCLLMISPLRISKQEGDQLMFFHERGVRAALGAMMTLGVSAPITMAGTAAVWLAQSFARYIISNALFGERELSIGGDVHPADLRTLMNCYGRPESAMSQVLMGELARRYRAGFAPHSGHTDAKVPGVEAGMQKALTATTTLIANGMATFSCGLLSVDEVFSPVQMVLDAELVGALRHMMRQREVSDETVALDVIRAVGPGKPFMDREHTVRHYREEIWEPSFWTRDMVQPFLASGKVSAEERARRKVREILDGPDHEPELTDSQEKKILAVIDRAGKALASN